MSWFGQASEHDADHGETDESGGGSCIALEVARQAAVSLPFQILLRHDCGYPNNVAFRRSAIVARKIDFATSIHENDKVTDLEGTCVHGRSPLASSRTTGASWSGKIAGSDG